MQYKILHFFFWVFYLIVCSSYQFQMVEICNNALDDDGDSLIDLNDPDCDCPIAEPVSLIPNPSFEEQECCPNNRGQLECATTWIQASEATTDYLHKCGWFGWDGLPVPLPLPDGEACIGFRNGRYGMEPNPNWKEYTGACLSTPLRKDNTYRFEFYIGFTSYPHSPPLNVVFYGSTDCQNLPFGVGDQAFGCPTNGPGWKELGRVWVSGTQTWIKTSITVTPKEDYHAIAIGPDCIEVEADSSLYYFFDDLVLADQKEFEYVISAGENPCAETFQLYLPERDSIQYQWYKNGIALPGETRSTLTPIAGEGQYSATLKSASFCKITKPYTYKKPVSYTRLSKILCHGEQLSYRDAILQSSGTYFDTLKTSSNCDSIIELNLEQLPFLSDSFQLKIFQGEELRIGNANIKMPGQYQALLSSTYGCDSMVTLDVDFYQVYIPTAFSPNGDGINDLFTIFGTDEINQINVFKIYDRWGGTLWQSEDYQANTPMTGWDGKVEYQLAPAGTYLYLIDLTMEDNTNHLLRGTFTLVR